MVSMETKGPGITIHMEVKPKGDFDKAFVFTKEEENLNISIPKCIFSDARDNVAIAVITYDSLSTLADNFTQTGYSTSHLVSPVMSISIYPQPVFEKDSWMEFSLQNTQPLFEPFVPVCSFWETTKNVSGGHWAQHGCEAASWTTMNTVCKCQHLTNFAVLMQLKPIPLPDHHRFALSLVTYIGCGMSICGSMATLLLHLISRCFTERAKILINLSLSLLVAHGTFVTGVNAVDNQTICRLTAIVLQYFFMASFFWMLAQGIALYVKVKIIFRTRSRFMYYCILGWGLPALIVGVSVGMRYHEYGVGEYCWLSMKTGLVWSFIGPIIVISSVNFFILCVLMRSFGQTKYKTESPGTKENNRIRTSVRAAIILLPVLGLTWIFGLLSVNKETIVFQYIFGVCNSSQGFAIFLLHCVFNDEVRSAWQRQINGIPAHSTVNQRSLSTCGRDATKPKSILKRTPSNSSTSSTKSVTLRQSPESVSPELWDVDTTRYSFSLGCLIPGRSKVIPITNPKVKLTTVNKANKFKATQNGNQF